MTDRALSEEAMLASLRDIALPSHAAGGLAADVFMTIALAGIAGLVVAGVLRLFSLRRIARPEPTIRDRLESVRALPDADRRIALLHMLRRHAPERYREIARDLYRPQSAVTAQRLEVELERLV